MSNVTWINYGSMETVATPAEFGSYENENYVEIELPYKDNIRRLIIRETDLVVSKNPDRDDFFRPLIYDGQFIILTGYIQTDGLKDFRIPARALFPDFGEPFCVEVGLKYDNSAKTQLTANYAEFLKIYKFICKRSNPDKTSLSDNYNYTGLDRGGDFFTLQLTQSPVVHHISFPTISAPDKTDPDYDNYDHYEYNQKREKVIDLERRGLDVRYY